MNQEYQKEIKKESFKNSRLLSSTGYLFFRQWFRIVGEKMRDIVSISKLEIPWQEFLLIKVRGFLGKWKGKMNYDTNNS